MSVPLDESDTPNVIWSVPAGTTGVVPVACVHPAVAGSASTSVQYVHPAAECRNTVRALEVPVDLYATDRSYVLPGTTAGAHASPSVMRSLRSPST